MRSKSLVANRRGGHPGGPNGEAQNWDSGIDMTMLGCTFFRNFASSFSAAMQLSDLWPEVARLEENSFIHNEAMIGASLTNWFMTFVSQIQ